MESPQTLWRPLEDITKFLNFPSLSAQNFATTSGGVVDNQSNEILNSPGRGMSAHKGNSAWEALIMRSE